MSAVVSVRVKKETKRELEKAGIDMGEEVRKHLEELARRISTKRQVQKWSKMLDRVTPSKEGFSVTTVREDRASH